MRATTSIKFLGALILLIPTLFLHGQKSELSLSFNPKYSYRIIKNDNGATISPDGEKAIYGYDVGIQYSRIAKAKKIGVETGISFTKLGWNYGDSFQSTESSQVSETEQILYFVDLPIKVFYRPFIEKSITPMFELGIHNYFLIKEFLHNPEQGTIDLNNTSARAYLPSISVGCGVLMRISKLLSIQVLPNFNYSPFSLYDINNAEFKRHLYSFGAELKVTYDLSVK